jgi:FtsH-binding integral membrane protein
MGYFTAACAGTGALTMMLRNSRLAMMNPWALLGVSMVSMIGTQMTSYDQNFALKNMLYAGFIGSMSLSLVPLIHMYSMPIIYDALIATGVTVGSLGVVAYNAPSEQFLNWGGPLALGLGGMLGISLLSIVYPGSPALYNIYLYGGLALFSAFMLYDTQNILYRAKTDVRFDPINSSLHVYMDAINIFVRFV